MLVICRSRSSGVAKIDETASKTPWRAVVVAGKPSSSEAMRLTVLRQSGESGGFGGASSVPDRDGEGAEMAAPDRNRRCRIACTTPRGRIPRNAKLPRRSGRVAILALMRSSTDACALRAVDASPLGTAVQPNSADPGRALVKIGRWKRRAPMRLCGVQGVRKASTPRDIRRAAAQELAACKTLASSTAKPQTSRTAPLISSKCHEAEFRTPQ